MIIYNIKRMPENSDRVKNKLLDYINKHNPKLTPCLEEIILNEDRLQSLMKISQQKFENTQELLDYVLDEAIHLTGSKIGYIYYYSEKEKIFTLNTWSKGIMKNCSVIKPQTTYRLDKTGLWGEVVRQRKPIIINDFKAENKLKKGYPAGHIELTSFLSIPVFYKNEIVAVVGVANKNYNYTENDIHQLRLLMDYCWRYTENIKSENKIKSVNKLLTVSGKVNKAIAQFTNYNDLLKESCQITVNEGRFKYVWASLFNRENHDLELIAEAGNPLGIGNSIIEKLKNDKNANLPCSEVLQNKKRYFYANLSTLKAKGFAVDEIIDTGFKSLIILPLVINNEIRGLYCIYDDKNDVFDKQELGIIEELATDLSLALEHHDKTMESKKLSGNLTKSEERYRLLFSHNLAGIYRTTLDGRIMDCNLKFAKMLEYNSVQEIKKASASNLYLNSSSRDKFILRLKEKGILENSECLLKTKHGKELWILENVMLIPATETEPEIIHGTCIDITERREMEQSLQKAKENWQSTFDAIQDIVVLLDKDHHILEINQTGIQALKQSKESIIGKHCFRIVHGTDKPIIECPCERSVQTKKPEFSVYQQENDFFELSAWPIYNEKKELEGFTHIVKNVTEKKIAEKELQKSEEKYRLLFDNNPQPMWIYDIETIEFLEVNQAAVNHYGYSKEEFLKMTLKDIRPVEDIPVLLEDIKNTQDALNTAGAWRHIKKNGKIIYVEITSHSLIFNDHKARHVLINDITEQKRAESDLLKLSRAVEQSPESIIITDINGTIEYVNPEFTKITGYTFEEVKGKNPNILQSGNQDVNFYKNLWNTIKKGKTWEGEFLNKKKNGLLYWEKASISPIFNDKRETVNYVAVKEDITLKKKYHEELIKAKEKAEESNRLKTAFLNNISHEVRTPMNAILGFSRLLKKQDLEQDKKISYIETINHSSNHLLSIITDILNISLIEAEQEKIRLSRVNVNNILDKILKQYELRSKDIKINFLSYLTAGQAEIYTDETKLIQIISNLVGNAIKFTQQGYVQCTCKLEKNYVRFDISDTGIGIPKGQLKKIFERFVQTENTLKNALGGMGLGLAIAKSYVDLLKGKISVRSKPGQGSVFTFTIPYKPAIENVKIKPTPKVKGKNLKKASILIAEDEFTNFLLIQELLTEFNIDIIYAENGKQAVEIALHNDIALVLMDIKMPEMDGFEALKIIREHKPNLKIIAQTAYALQLNKAQIKSSKFDDYIEKPIKEEELLNMIRKHVQ